MKKKKEMKEVPSLHVRPTRRKERKSNILGLAGTQSRSCIDDVLSQKRCLFRVATMFAIREFFLLSK